MVVVRPAPGDSDAAQLPAADGPVALRAASARLVRARGAGTELAIQVAGLSGEDVAAVAEGAVLGGYAFSRHSSPLPPVVVRLAGAREDDVAAGVRRAAATCWARDLANTPAAVKSPDWLGAQARRVLAPLGVDVTVRDETWLAEQAFGGVLAVGAGSAVPPRLIEAAWRPRRAPADPHVVLVGKGITFDSGGLNLKPGDGMRMMHTDMAGGAAVLAALRLVAQAELPVRVTALVPAAQNAFGGASMRPSDVLRHVNGRTTEVGNTDAEGRLVLADALAYAAERLRPSVLVDAATLTGAAKVALGLRTGALFATDDGLAGALCSAGERVGQPLWRLPLAREYAASLHSPVADARNDPGAPGAITAALFLEPFTAGLPWAHLDIAGPARAPGDDGELTKGATGFGARLLADWASGLR